MNQDAFERERNPTWVAIEQTLQRSQESRRFKNDVYEDESFISRYKELNRDLALAQSRGYSQELLERLNKLVVETHRLLHAQSSHWWESIWLYIIRDFPRELRNAKAYVAIAALLFTLPALVLIVLIEYYDATFLYSVTSPASLQNLEQMYDPASERFNRIRGSDSNISMFGFYIYNNISIALRTFAWGALFGVGTVLVLMFNSIFLGAVFYHLVNIGYSATLFTFVIAHGAFELTAIVFAGAAGLMVGYSLLNPGRLRRVDALKQSVRRAIRIMLGVFIMLIIAAFIEAFWSSIYVFPDLVKYLVGGLMWVLVASYFIFLGRNAA